MKVVRDVVSEKYDNRIDAHTLQDFNNHSLTTFEEIISTLTGAGKKIISHIEN